MYLHPQRPSLLTSDAAYEPQRRWKVESRSSVPVFHSLGDAGGHVLGGRPSSSLAVYMCHEERR
jgi:hypothetical protein